MRRCPDSRSGLALVVTLWVMVILVVMLLGFSSVVSTDITLSGNYAHEAKALSLALAGFKRAVIQLENPPAPYVSTDEEWTVMDSETDELDLTTGTYEVRLLDESGKLNLNLADEDMLTQLFGEPMIVDSILDWRDEDSEPREQGAEDDTYLELQPPYYCKNGPFETLPELLLVNGMTRELFFGENYGAEQSALRSLLSDEAEQEQPNDDTAKPLTELLTLYSADSNSDQNGQPRVNLRTASEEELKQKLGEVLTDEEVLAIVRYRTSGEGDDDDDSRGSPNQPGVAPPAPQPGGGAASVVPGGGRPPSGAAPSRQAAPGGQAGPTPSAGARPPGTPSGQPTQPTGESSQPPDEGAQQQGGGQQQSSKFEKLGELLSVQGLGREKVGQILDLVTVTDEPLTPGRVNVNTAPLEVLLALPLMTEEAAQDILSHRQVVGPFTEIGEILQIESLTDAMFAELADHLTVRSNAFRIVADGVIAASKIRRRIECIVLVEEQPQTAPANGAVNEGAEAGPADTTAPGGPPPGSPSAPLSRQAVPPGGPSGAPPGAQPSPASPERPGAEETEAGEPTEAAPPQRTVRIVYWRQ